MVSDWSGRWFLTRLRATPAPRCRAGALTAPAGTSTERNCALVCGRTDGTRTDGLGLDSLTTAATGTAPPHPPVVPLGNVDVMAKPSRCPVCETTGDYAAAGGVQRWASQRTRVSLALATDGRMDPPRRPLVGRREATTSRVGHKGRSVDGPRQAECAGARSRPGLRSR